MDITIRNDGKGKHQSIEAVVTIEPPQKTGYSTLELTAWGASEQEARWNLMLQAREAIQALSVLVPPLRIPRAAVLSLDLEGTLVSNAVSVIPRPGLRTFLVTCLQNYPDVVIYSSCTTERVREILGYLESEKEIPAGFTAKTQVFHSGPGSVKDLSLIGTPEDIIHVDDQNVVMPGQEAFHVRIPEFAHPYPDSDRVLLDLTAGMVR